MHAAGSIPCRQHQRRAACKEGGNDAGCLQHALHLLGNPPKTFDFEYRDKDKQFHRECGLTPKEFYAKYIGLNLNDYISLINAPTADKPYYRSYTVQ